MDNAVSTHHPEKNYLAYKIKYCNNTLDIYYLFELPIVQDGFNSPKLILEPLY